jgi:predicted anti-sigma-YlaC factor YlaD
MYRARHLREERLFDCYLAASAGEPIDPPVVEHLTDCAECSARYADLTRFMENLRTEADAETDAVFTPDRLRVQQQRIAERLRHLGQRARVISFPGRTQAVGSATHRAHRATRWVAAAAAAGLFIGVGLGVFYDGGLRGSRASHQVATSFASHPALVPTSEAADEAFLSELELAADRPHTRELAAFDALTPHVREVATTIR